MTTTNVCKVSPFTGGVLVPQGKKHVALLEKDFCNEKCQLTQKGFEAIVEHYKTVPKRLCEKTSELKYQNPFTGKWVDAAAKEKLVAQGYLTPKGKLTPTIGMDKLRESWPVTLEVTVVRDKFRSPDDKTIDEIAEAILKIHAPPSMENQPSDEGVTIDLKDAITKLHLLTQKAKEAISEDLMVLPLVSPAAPGRGDLDKPDQAKGPVTKGWHDQAPKRGKARTELKEKCGSKCFGAPNEKKYPICTSDCKVSRKGTQAAYSRAKQQHNEAVARRVEKVQKQHGWVPPSRH